MCQLGQAVTPISPGPRCIPLVTAACEGYQGREQACSLALALLPLEVAERLSAAAACRSSCIAAVGAHGCGGRQPRLLAPAPRSRRRGRRRLHGGMPRGRGSAGPARAFAAQQPRQQQHVPARREAGGLRPVAEHARAGRRVPGGAAARCGTLPVLRRARLRLPQHRIQVPSRGAGADAAVRQPTPHAAAPGARLPPGRWRRPRRRRGRRHSPPGGTCTTVPPISRGSCRRPVGGQRQPSSAWRARPALPARLRCSRRQAASGFRSGSGPGSASCSCGAAAGRPAGAAAALGGRLRPSGGVRRLDCTPFLQPLGCVSSICCTAQSSPANLARGANASAMRCSTVPRPPQDLPPPAWCSLLRQQSDAIDGGGIAHAHYKLHLWPGGGGGGSGDGSSADGSIDRHGGSGSSDGDGNRAQEAADGFATDALWVSPAANHAKGVWDEDYMEEVSGAAPRNQATYPVAFLRAGRRVHGGTCSHVHPVPATPPASRACCTS